MNIDNVFDLLVAVVFDMGTQLVGIGLKGKNIVISFHLGER